MRMLATARPRQVDIAIAGGGLAGSAAAAVLARQGFDVALVDPYPTYPPDLRCEKLDGSQVATLRRTGLADLVLPAAAEYAGFWVARFGRVVAERVETQYGILYDTLVNQVRSTIPPRVRIIAGKVTSIVPGRTSQEMGTSNGDSVRSRLVVIATGLNNGLRSSLRMGREQVSRCHSVTLAFHVRPRSGSFPFPALTYFGERPADRVAYITLFPVPGGMRANLMAYREQGDPWLRQMREEPAETLHRTLPGLAAVTGRMDIVGPVIVRPADLAVSSRYLVPGVVLVGDAFATSCPAAGTGTNKVFTDVDRLCNVHAPAWLQGTRIGVDELSAFYGDPVKAACDRHSMAKAFRLRSDTVGTGLAARARRWGRYADALACGRRGTAASGPAIATAAGRAGIANAPDGP